MVAARARCRWRSDAKALAATAAVALVRIIELEAFVEAFTHKIELRPVDVGEAFGVDEHLYAVNADGVGYVVRLGGKKGEIVAQNELGEAILGSPAVADGALYLRSDAHLWKIAAE